MTNRVEIREFSIVVVAKNHNPTILNPDFLKYNDIVPRDWELAKAPICVEPVSGVLVRWPVTIFADEGDDLTIESTIFVPDDQIDDLPNFIGLDGFLSRINFAVDPFNQYFHFGA